MQQNTEQQHNLVIRLIRISGGMIAAFGLCFYFDLAGLATSLDLTADGTNKIIGPILTFVGFLDIVLVPTIISRAWEKKK